MTRVRDCSDADTGRLLAAYDAGLLAVAERERVERHLADCGACQEELYGLAAHMTALRHAARSQGRRLIEQTRWVMSSASTRPR